MQNGAYIDDWNLRCTLEDLMKMHQIICAFDEAAGHKLQHEKTAFVTTSQRIKELLRKTPLNGHLPRYGDLLNLVGEPIVTALRRITAPADERMTKAIKLAERLCSLPAHQGRKARVAAAAVLPTAIYATQWNSASMKKCGQLASRMLTAALGRGKSLQCAETVTSVLHGPTLVDPLHSSALRTVLLTNRLVEEEPRRLDIIRHNLGHIWNGAMPKNAHGPTLGLLQACEVVGPILQEENVNIMVANQLGTKVNSSTLSNTELSHCAKEASRYQVMKSLGERAIKPSSKTGKPTRADLVDVPSCIEIAVANKLLMRRTHVGSDSVGECEIKDRKKVRANLTNSGRQHTPSAPPRAHQVAKCSLCKPGV